MFNIANYMLTFLNSHVLFRMPWIQLQVFLTLSYLTPVIILFSLLSKAGSEFFVKVKLFIFITVILCCIFEFDHKYK